jgi:hypothetical protein
MPRDRWPALILAGFGASDALQITLESYQLAVRIGRALSLGLPGRLGAALEAQGVEIAALDSLYDEADFPTSYARIAATVLARAEHDPPAMLLSQGSPLFLNGLTRYLVVEARKRELTTRVLPAVSPVDAIVADLGIDVGLAGLQTLSARGFAARRVAMPAMPLLLLQLAGVAGAGASAEAYGPLVQALGAVYAASQPVTLLNMPGDGRITRATVTLARFAELVPHIDASSSLFIDIARPAPSPPQEPPNVVAN